jgi:hypothetical protein
MADVLGTLLVLENKYFPPEPVREMEQIRQMADEMTQLKLKLKYLPPPAAHEMPQDGAVAVVVAAAVAAAAVASPGAAQKYQCLSCWEEFELQQGVLCVTGEHFYCKTCFPQVVKSQIDEGEDGGIGRFRQREANVVCTECQAPYSELAIAQNVDAETWGLYRQAVKRVHAAVGAREIVARKDQEIADLHKRLVAMGEQLPGDSDGDAAGQEERIQRHCEHIENEILTVRCQRCQTPLTGWKGYELKILSVFLLVLLVVCSGVFHLTSFSQSLQLSLLYHIILIRGSCFAVQCGTCHERFCGWCCNSTGAEEPHRHAMSCPKNFANQGSIGGSWAEAQRAFALVKVKRLTQYVNQQVARRDRAALQAVIAVRLGEHGIRIGEGVAVGDGNEYVASPESVTDAFAKLYGPPEREADAYDGLVPAYDFRQLYEGTFSCGLIKENLRNNNVVGCVH